VSSTEACKREAAPALLVELPMALVVASNLDPAMAEECWKTNPDTMGAISLHLLAARSQPDVVAATSKVQRLWEILPITS
jgi:hypothetical protein